tara:strand:+ start:3672 stop:4598 length:927 start_codon:yes stop_codon:yes gene_type:complete
MIIIKLFFIFIFFTVSHIQATYYMVISDLGISAQSIALGNIHGYSSSSEAIFSNPASLINSQDYSFSIFSSKVMNEVDYLQLSLTADIDFGSIGAGVYHQKVTDIPATYQYMDSNVGQTKIQQIGSYAYKNSLYKIAYQSPVFKQSSLGISFNYYHISVDTVKGSGTNFDIGIITPLPFNSIKTSFYAQNIIPNRRVNYSNNQSELLPFIFSSSIIIPIYHLTLIPQISYQKSQVLFSSGLSYTPAFLPYIDLLAGYKQQLDYLSNKHQKLTFGFGLTLFALDIYYAYERSDYFFEDHNTYVSLNYEL